MNSLFQVFFIGICLCVYGDEEPDVRNSFYSSIIWNQILNNDNNSLEKIFESFISSLRSIKTYNSNIKRCLPSGRSNHIIEERQMSVTPITFPVWTNPIETTTSTTTTTTTTPTTTTTTTPTTTPTTTITTTTATEATQTATPTTPIATTNIPKCKNCDILITIIDACPYISKYIEIIVCVINEIHQCDVFLDRSIRDFFKCIDNFYLNNAQNNINCDDVNKFFKKLLKNYKDFLDTWRSLVGIQKYLCSNCLLLKCQ
ncbi:G8 domain-containing protein DDB_G0286311-like [Centruroides sculpturatus]|uniref:G8 domain-containing protein DDB_G0286311-like n=1 Tax=Centruroides sculpturatus TaxID=218467 RepID=UPI000C6D3154|nr:G8 domain-containing protein DDB_G0286311-like [Centruroides sculpturatus]